MSLKEVYKSHTCVTCPHYNEVCVLFHWVMVISTHAVSWPSYYNNMTSLGKVITKLPQALIHISKRCIGLKNTCGSSYSLPRCSWVNYFQAIKSFFSDFLSSLQVDLLCVTHASTNLCLADHLQVHWICYSAEHKVHHQQRTYRPWT